MPTRQDVDLARAAIDRGFLTIKESVKCLEIQRDYETGGQMVPLERIFVEADYLSKRQLHLLKESVAKANALRHVGHYEIMSKVGAGGMGTVYQAKDQKADRIVALKILSPAHASNKEYIERFLREAHASGRLSHPNIVQGFDAGESNGQYYFAMEFVDGVTVGSMLKESRPIPEQQALDIAIQISKALDHAEENHLIHRDIKPDNIMIMKDGAAKLADLGLARLTKGDPGAQEQRIFGTPYYASPEQCQGFEELDPKTDMYSFGATLFHMLAGRVAFDDETPEEIMGRHLHDKRPYLKDINVQLSHGVSKIVRKLMAIHKRDRYPSMAEVTTDLTLVRMGRSPRLGERSRYDSSEHRYRSETGSWRTRPANRRKTMANLGMCIGGAVAILVALFFLFQWWSARDAPAGKPAPPKNTVTSRPAHQIFFDNILARKDKLRDDLFVEKLRTVSEEYPNTESAKRAEELAARIVKKIEAEAEAVFGEMAAAALRLRNEQRYQAAIDKLVDLPDRYKGTDFPEEMLQLRRAIGRQAEIAFEKIKAAAEKLAAEKKYTEAAALYAPVVEKFGISTLKANAEAAVASIEKTGAGEKAKAEEEAKRKAEEERGRIRKERLAIQAALQDSRQLVKEKGSFGGAAAKMKAALDEAASDGSKASLARAVSDLEELQKLFDGLKKAGTSLKGKRIALVRKNNVELEGTVFRINDKGISLLAGRSAIRSVSWNDIAPDSVKMLAKLTRDGRFSPAQQRAFAALFFFSGKTDEAKAELNALAETPAEKKAATLRLKDIEFFGKVLREELPEVEL